ncbi:hypothetical protein TcBrA4_0064700 [Trypanosoma cruzi]|nr:hypothetical protein TcBrA4_0064700 [Trypanosoma cruzi]
MHGSTNCFSAEMVPSLCRNGNLSHLLMCFGSVSPETICGHARIRNCVALAVFLITAAHPPRPYFLATCLLEAMPSKCNAPTNDGAGYCRCAAVLEIAQQLSLWMHWETSWLATMRFRHRLDGENCSISVKL